MTIGKFLLVRRFEKRTRSRGDTLSAKRAPRVMRSVIFSYCLTEVRLEFGKLG